MKMPDILAAYEIPPVEEIIETSVLLGELQPTEVTIEGAVPPPPKDLLEATDEAAGDRPTTRPSPSSLR